MEKLELIKLCENFVANSEGNYIKEDYALSPELAGIRFFDPPLIGFASARDGLFETYKSPEIIGAHYMTPQEWLPGSETVISIFFHFSEDIVESNAADFKEPSMLWLQGYKEGMAFIKETLRYVCKTLSAAGMEAIVPILDERFRAIEGKSDIDGFASNSSNWSERHAAFAAGLGTFGLSRGLITEKGVAGRFGSIITKGVFSPTERRYTASTQYCNNCGECIAHCPVDAISYEKGKEHLPCHVFLEKMNEKYSSARGSCGKCQVGTQCTYQAPGSK